MVEFDWDDGNRSHIALHHVSCSEAEQAILNDPLDLDFQADNGEERFLQLGETTAGRILMVVSTWRRNMSVRVITAFDAPKAMKLTYLAERGKTHGRKAHNS